MTAGAFILFRAGCLWIGAIDLIPKGTGVVPPSIVHLIAGFVNHLPIYEPNTAHHSRNGELLLLWWGHISCNCEKWVVMSGSRKMISQTRRQVLSSLTPRALYIHMSPQMCSDMNHFIRSRFNDKGGFITNVGIFGLAVAFPFPLRLPFGAIAAS